MRRSRGAGAKRLQGGHGDGERARGGGEYREYRRGATPNRRYHKRHGVRTLEPTKFFVLVALVSTAARLSFSAARRRRSFGTARVVSAQCHAAPLVP